MQSTFFRGVTQPLAAISDDWLRRQPHARPAPPVPPPPPPPAGAGAAVAAPPPPPPAGAPAAVPAPPPPPVIVYPPLQRFTLGKYEYFIKPGMRENTEAAGRHTGFWIVPYVLDPAPMPGVVGIPGRQTARPADAIDELPDGLKDQPGMPSIQHMVPYPNRNYARINEHYIASTEDKTYLIQFKFLKSKLELAEKMDYDFAIRMQGLQNCNFNAVWCCTDMGYDAYDRSLMMEQFLRGYVGRFLAQVSQKPGRDLNPDHVVREAIQMHDKFCDAWVKEHKRGLSPLIESCAEALVGNFCEGVLKPAVLAGLTRMEISRMLRRDKIFSPQFGLCLHFFMVKLDQDRSGRNANYKSMYNSMSSNVLAMKTFENFMQINAARLHEHISGPLREFEDREFHQLTIDWYGIVTQLHGPSVQYTGVNKRRRGGGRAAAGGGDMDGAMGPDGLWG